MHFQVEITHPARRYQTRFQHAQLCTDSFKAHQQKQCTPTMLEYVKCGTKL